MSSFPCEAVLFDLDGVLVDSRACVEHQWSAWAARHGLDRGQVLRLAHGRRAVEAVGILAPGLDPVREAAELAAGEMADTAALSVVPGASALSRGLPSGSWAIVTSAPRAVAEARIAHVGQPRPAVIVAAEDVTRGKPDPQGYLMAAARLGVAPSACVVIEDAPAGIAAGRAAGMHVVAVATTYPAAALAGADICVSTLADLAIVPGDKGAEGGARSRLTVVVRDG
jgi:mannitol-1-/sugar-/sorbitol-6-phosphatase